MAKDRHFARLEEMYKAAPINKFYKPNVSVGEGSAEIEIDVVEKFFHAAHAAHGSIYFKMLDDAAFFAANSLEKEFFVLTSAFTVYFTRPVNSGKIRSVGKVIDRTKSQFVSEAVAYNSDGKQVGHGSGIFVISKIKLKDGIGFKE